LRLGVLVAVSLLGVALASISHGAGTRPILMVAVAALLAGVPLALLVRGWARRGRVVMLAAVLLGLTAACLVVFGPSPLATVAFYVPLVIVAGSMLGAPVAFVVADAVVVVWALLAGLAAGGLMSSGVLHEPPRVLAELGSMLVILNGIALATAWAMRDADPDLHEERRRLETERRELASQLEVLQPLASVGQLVTHVAHEVGNPLQAMDHFLFALLDETPEDDERRQHLLLLKQGIDRIAQYLEQLSEFYRPSAEAGRVDVNRLVEDVFRFLATQLRNSNVKVTQELGPDLPPAAITLDRLRQVILNLVLNAVEAMPEGGELSVSTSVRNGQVILALHDSGVGIPCDSLPDVFEPFCTTKSGRGGMGLGLSISQRMLRGVGGEISIDSDAGLGTRVVVEMPRAGD
jgi:signal transduction histidine kinase